MLLAERPDSPIGLLKRLVERDAKECAYQRRKRERFGGQPMKGDASRQTQGAFEVLHPVAAKESPLVRRIVRLTASGPDASVRPSS